MKEIDETIATLRQAKNNLLVAQKEIQTLKHYYEDALSENQKLKDRVESLNTQIGLLKAENDTLTKSNIDLKMEVQRMQRRSLWDIFTGR
jgi:regulator of replication initiation timing